MTRNNIVVVASNLKQKPILIVSGGHLDPKLKGRKKISVVAVKLIVGIVARRLRFKKNEKKFIFVFLMGGNRIRRKSALLVFRQWEINIKGIIDFSPIPHNGCRLKKKARK